MTDNTSLQSEEPLIYLRKRGSKVELAGHGNGFVGTRDSASDTGFFLEWTWDGTEVVVRSYPYGFYPAFYYRDATTFALARKIQPLIRLLPSVEIDTETLSVYLHTGHVLGDRTVFKQILALPEGGLLTWKPGGQAKASQRPASEPMSAVDRDHVIDSYIDLFRQAISRCHVENIRLPLSGGQDSRHILLELVRQEKPIDKAVTMVYFPDNNTNDLDLAATLAHKTNTTHDVIPQRSSFVVQEARKNEINGFSLFGGNWKIDLAEHCDSRSYDVFDGIAGDVLSAGVALNRELHKHARNGDAYAVIDKKIGNRGARLEPLVCGGEIEILKSADVRDLLAEHFSLYCDDHNPLASFYLWSSTRRQIAMNTVCIFGHGRIHAPFLDNDLFDYLRSIPFEMLVSRKLHRETIRRAYPEFAKIPFARTQATRLPFAFRRDCVWGLAKFLRSTGYDGINARRLWVRLIKMLARSPIRYTRNACIPQLVCLRQIERLARGE